MKNDLPLLELQNVQKIFQDGTSTHSVLKNISLILEKDMFYCIYGESGSGKSTLLHILATLETITSGTMQIEQENLYIPYSSKKIQKYRQETLGFIFQSHYLLPSLTLLENLMLPLLQKKYSYKLAIEKAFETLKEFSIEKRADSYPHNISGGESQRAAIGRAVIHKPKLILADEPTGNLDEKNTDIFFSYLQDIHKKYSSTILLVTHERRLQEQIPNRYELKDGILHKIHT